MKLGVYVGSFDPVHKGHTEIVDYLINKKYVDELVVIPTGNYWDKQDLTSLEKRAEMLCLAFGDKAIVDTSLSKYEYTWEIMASLSKKYPKDELYLIIGADNVVDFDKWRNYKEILKNYVLVIPRDNIDVSYYVSKYEEKGRFILVKDFVSNNISSTFIRESIKNRKFNYLNVLLEEKVLNYIFKNKLYME